MLRFAVGLAAIFWTSMALAQTLPFHADPGAREQAPDLSLVPAIRFLTTADFPPFNYRDTTGELIGFHIDLAGAICDTLDVTCTVQAWPWDQAVDALADNQGDALIAGLALNEITAEQFDFSSLYLMLPGRFVSQRGLGPDVGVDDLAGGTIAVRRNSAHAKFLKAYLPQLVQVPFDSEIKALDGVKAGRAKHYFGDAMRASFWLNENYACCEFVGEAYFNPEYFGEGMAMAIPAGRNAVRAAIDFALIRLKRNGKLDELYLRWFPISFY